MEIFSACLRPNKAGAILVFNVGSALVRRLYRSLLVKMICGADRHFRGTCALVTVEEASDYSIKPHRKLSDKVAYSFFLHRGVRKYLRFVLRFVFVLVVVQLAETREKLQCQHFSHPHFIVCYVLKFLEFCGRAPPYFLQGNTK